MIIILIQHLKKSVTYQNVVFRRLQLKCGRKLLKKTYNSFG